MEPQNIDTQKPSIDLEELPNELLVYIFSLLPTSRDIVRLRYVSRKIRSISEIPSLWNNFLWPWYDKREEKSLNEALKVCGAHVNRLVFPDVVSCVGTSVERHESSSECDDLCKRNIWMYSFDNKENLFVIELSTAMKMLKYCCNVTKVTLGICLNGDEMKEIVEKMKYLRNLEICCRTSPPIRPIIAAAGCANLKTLVLRGVDIYDVQKCLSEWVHAGFQPPNLSVVVHKHHYILYLFECCLPEMLQQWPQWNSQISTGHTARFNLYFAERNLLDTSSAPLAVFQLDFGQTTYPFVKASNFGLFGFGKDLLLITNSASDGKVVHKALVIQSDKFSFCTSNLCCNVSSLRFVTDFTATECGLLSGHLEQLSIACPNLKRLYLSGNRSCLKNLQGLRNIVDHCHNLQAVNLEGVHVTKIENCMELWKVLSEIKMLNHLRIEICTMKPLIEIDVCSQHSFVQLALNFVCLKQLELTDSQHDCLPFGNELQQAYPVLLSHFPSLVYYFTEATTIVTDIITKCKQLKYFKYNSWKRYLFRQSSSTAPNKHLQYLDIRLSGDIGEVFMDSVSAHGKLEIVILEADSFTEAGITALIENSPMLCLLKIHFGLKFGLKFFNNKYEQLKTLKDTLKKRLLHRKLFNLDGFIIKMHGKWNSTIII